MKSYVEVKTQADMETLLASIAGFHDSMAKEFHIVNRGFVDSDQSMVGSHRFDVQLLVQSQWEPYAIELVFCDVAELHVTDAREYWAATGYVRGREAPVEIKEVEMKFDSSLRIKGSALFYRVRTQWLGRRAFLNAEVPSNDTVPAQILEGRWRICSSCSEAWEEDPEDDFSYCSGCGCLTELQTKSAEQGREGGRG